MGEIIKKNKTRQKSFFIITCVFPKFEEPIHADFYLKNISK